MKASSSSLPDVVESAGLTMVVLAVPLSLDTFASIAGAGTAVAVKATPVTFAPLTVTVWLAGLKRKLGLVGVTV